MFPLINITEYEGVSIAKEINYAFNYDGSNIDLMWLLGIIYSNGHIYKDEDSPYITISYDIEKRDVISKILLIAAKLDIRHSYREDPEFGRSIINIYDSYFMALLDPLGIRIDNLVNKTLPERLFTATREEIKAFVSGYFHVNKYAIKTTSQKLAHQLQELLTAINIKANVLFEESFYQQKLYTIAIIDSLWTEKMDNLANHCATMQSRIISYPFSPSVVLSDDNERDKPMFSYNRCDLTSLSKIRNILHMEGKDTSQLDQLLRHIPIRIKSVKEIGIEEAYDITVDQEHNYIVNGIKVSNCGPIGFMEEFNLTADVVTRNNIRKGK